MIVNKYTGKTKEEAIEKAKADLGENVVISSERNRKPDGVLGIFKPSIWEVTAFLEEDTDGSVSQMVPLITRDTTPTSTFSAVADEKIEIDNSEQIRDAFREISQVFEEAEKKAENKADKEVAEIKKPVTKTESTPKPAQTVKKASKKPGDNIPAVKLVYDTLLENEVDERCINGIFDDIGNVLSAANNLDLMLSNIYQKMILKLGAPNPISLEGKGPFVAFFIGPTGVGKTTTIAKIAGDYYKQGKKVGFVTADSYRIAAAEQLSNYANIMMSPIEIIISPDELNGALEKMKDVDIVFVDTFGFSHKNDSQKATMKELVNIIDPKYTSANFLVLSVTTKYEDLKEIVDVYKQMCNVRIIFTKLDETNCYGNILNIKLYSGCELSYVTNGQEVPNDFEVLDGQKLVKSLLGVK